MSLKVWSVLFAAWLRVRPRMEDETGAVATEYALLLVMIAMAIIGTVTALGLAISSKFQAARDCVANLPVCP